MKPIYLKSAFKFDPFDVSIDIQIPFSRVSVTIEPGRSLLKVRYHELFDCNFSALQIATMTLFLSYKHTCVLK